MSRPESAPRLRASAPPPKWGAVDALAIAGFVLLAALYAIGRGVWLDPYLFLDADAAKLASWAAALDHPDAFTGDSSLGDTSDFRYYFTIHLPLLRGLTRLTGHYGASFGALLWPALCVQLIAFYVLGRSVCASRYFGVLFALVTFPPVSLNLWETWGVMLDALPRILFQALLPFVLVGVLASLRHPARWPIFLAALGLLMYVHPVSTPAWAFAVWLGLWLCHPPSWSGTRRVLTMFGLGLVFLAVAGLFLWIYLTQHEHGVSEEIPVEKVREISGALLPPEYFDAPLALRQFVALAWGPLGVLWVAAALGAAAVWRLRPASRRALAVVFAWIAGIAIVSFAIPWATQTLERALGMAPVDILLSRNLRYFVPVAMLLAAWGLAAVALEPQLGPRGRHALRALGAGLVIGWWVVHVPPPLQTLASCARLGTLFCHPGGWPEAVEAVEAVRRETPPGAKILPTRFAHSVQVRFHAFRPVVHSRWDPAVLMMGNHEKLLAWYEIHNEQKRIRGLPQAERAPAVLALARRLEADYVLLDSAHLPPQLPIRSPVVPRHRVVWSNAAYALLEIAPSGQSAPPSDS